MDARALLSDNINLAVPAAIVLLLGTMVIVPWLTQDRCSSNFPLVGNEIGTFYKRRKHFFQHGLDLHHKGYIQYRDSAFRVTESEGEVVVLPIRFLEELRKLPDDVLSNAAPLNHTLQKPYLGHNAFNPFLHHVIRADLTHNLPKINDAMAKEVAQTTPEYMGTSRDWQSINIHAAILKMVAVISGHVFIGPKLNRHEIYLHTSILYTVDLFTAAGELKAWPHLLRPVAQYFVPRVKTVHEHRRRAREFLLPVIKERRRRRQAGEEEPHDVLQWMIAKADKFDIKDDTELADTQLELSFAAIHTTTMAVTHVVYDLVARCPEVIPELRKEIQAVLQENDNDITTQALFQMKLLDSVMRETMRMNTNSISNFNRYVARQVALSDGTILRAGTAITVSHSEPFQDPALFPSPDRYDPYRFFNLRAGKTQDPLNYSNTEQYQFVSVTKEAISFGYGRHACPGRFFASNEIKLMLARILMDYDLRMPDGVEGRYKNIVMGTNIGPDPTKEVMIKYIGR